MQERLIQQMIRFLILVMAVGLSGVSGCSSSDEDPKKTPQTKRVKITTGQIRTDPVTAESPDAAPRNLSEGPVNPELSPFFAEVNNPPRTSNAYMIKGKADPFLPLFRKEEKNVDQPSGPSGKRVPQSPLETMDLSQLKLTAVFRIADTNRALVEEATGKGYMIEKGTYVGLNGGRVAEILKDQVIIKEETVNALGDKTTHEIILDLPGLDVINEEIQ